MQIRSAHTNNDEYLTIAKFWICLSWECFFFQKKSKYHLKLFPEVFKITIGNISKFIELLFMGI